MSVSPSRMSAREETLRSTVGRDADVPRKRRVSDMRAKYIVTLTRPCPCPEERHRRVTRRTHSARRTGIHSPKGGRWERCSEGSVVSCYTRVLAASRTLDGPGQAGNRASVLLAHLPRLGLL